jgi:hypothetical protein
MAKKGQSTNNDLQNITQKTKNRAKLPNTKISRTVKGQTVSENCRWYFHVFISEICCMLANLQTLLHVVGILDGNICFTCILERVASWSYIYLCNWCIR